MPRDAHPLRIRIAPQHTYAWYVTPTMDELERETDGADGREHQAEQPTMGRHAHLVLPFSFWHHTIFRPFGPSDFSSLGAGVRSATTRTWGDPTPCLAASLRRAARATRCHSSVPPLQVELYFGTLVTLGLVFILMGLVDLGSLLSNIYAFRADKHTCADEGATGWTDINGFKCSDWEEYDCSAAIGYSVPALVAVRKHCPRCCRLPLESPRSHTFMEWFLIGGTLGARIEQFDLSSHGWIQVATQMVFMLCLVWLHFFNTTRSRLIQETTITAADYTVKVRGLRAAGLQGKVDVAIAFASIVQEAWAQRRGERLDSRLDSRQHRVRKGARFKRRGDPGWWMGGKTTAEALMRECAAILLRPSLDRAAQSCCAVGAGLAAGGASALSGAVHCLTRGDLLDLDQRADP
jgi:hypothetical protein